MFLDQQLKRQFCVGESRFFILLSNFVRFSISHVQLYFSKSLLVTDTLFAAWNEF